MEALGRNRGSFSHTACASRRQNGVLESEGGRHAPKVALFFNICASRWQNGVLESEGGRYSILYPCGGAKICRKPIPSGSETVAYSLGARGNFFKKTRSVPTANAEDPCRCEGT